MKLLFDFFPVVLFFITYKLYGIYAATAVTIAATLLLVAYSWLRHRQVAKMQWVVLIMVCVMGGMTLYFHDERFIKWKVTLVNWAFAAVFLGSQFVGKQTLVERMMSEAIQLPDQVWRRLNSYWASFFFAMGATNIYVMRNFDTETWANFKMFGVLGLTVLFALLQVVFIYKYIPEVEAKE